jgi:hypothetical protein
LGAAQGIYGEKLWLHDRTLMPPAHRSLLRLLSAVGAVTLALLTFGLIRLQVWPTIFGATVLVLAQLWRIDKLGQLHHDRGRSQPQA